MLHQRLDELLAGGPFDGTTLVLVDRSISMSYGFGTPKLEVCKGIARKILEKARAFGVLIFDHIVEVALETTPKPEAGELERAIGPVPARGMTAISSALRMAASLLDRAVEPKRIVLLSDGRLNFSLDGTINECGPNLRSEALAEARKLAVNGIRMDCAAIGEDSYVWILDQLSEIAGGSTYIPDGDLLEAEPRLILEAEIHGVPEELPAGRPTWAKELDSEHLVVASKEAFYAYSEKRAALLVNKASGKIVRVPLLSIEDDALKPFRERRMSTAKSVREGNAILVDSANRRSLDLKPGDKALLKIF
ncbi:MAG: VWA domain-containing protein [Candidatus Brockarchaeota archaeon]|nr:VWA domain-containing protein [Candidatus Brockarchaeota archaeon]